MLRFQALVFIYLRQSSLYLGFKHFSPTFGNICLHIEWFRWEMCTYCILCLKAAFSTETTSSLSVDCKCRVMLVWCSLLVFVTYVSVYGKIYFLVRNFLFFMWIFHFMLRFPAFFIYLTWPNLIRPGVSPKDVSLSFFLKT